MKTLGISRQLHPGATQKPVKPRATEQRPTKTLAQPMVLVAISDWNLRIRQRSMISKIPGITILGANDIAQASQILRRNKGVRVVVASPDMAEKIKKERGRSIIDITGVEDIVSSVLKQLAK